jgi:NAD(P)-dependent dehydrogenase (short-subunit alcohol dehydrogenase family)
MTLHRPLALVTGGMRRLGAAIAERLAQAGYDLALSSHIEGGPDTDFAAGTDWHGFLADLSDPAVPAKLLNDVTSRFAARPICWSTTPRYSGRMTGQRWMQPRWTRIFGSTHLHRFCCHRPW